MIELIKNRVTETTKNVVFVLSVVASDLLAALCFDYKLEKNKREWRELREEFDEKLSSKRLWEIENWKYESELKVLRKWRIGELEYVEWNDGMIEEIVRL